MGEDYFLCAYSGEKWLCMSGDEVVMALLIIFACVFAAVVIGVTVFGRRK